MPVVIPDKLPPFFDRPFVGQPFFRKQNDARYEEGHVSGVKVLGTFLRRNPETGEDESVEDWVATIETGFSSQHRFDCRVKPTATSWLPLPSEQAEMRYGPGYMRLRARVDELVRENADLRERLGDIQGGLKVGDNLIEVFRQNVDNRLEVLEARAATRAVEVVLNEPPSVVPQRRTRTAAVG